jgi:hypothetical protein
MRLPGDCDPTLAPIKWKTGLNIGLFKWVSTCAACRYGAAYGLRTPGTPQDWDYSPLPGGGIQCCGDGALGAVAPGTDTDEAAAVPVSLLYNVTWLPNTTEVGGLYSC